MADSFIQLPADSTGKQLDTVIVNMGVGATQVHREKMVVADPLSTSAFAVVTSSQGLQVSSTQAQTISGTVTVLSASSGLIQISGTPVVTATAGTNPWSSAPGFNVPVVSVSSGLVQISGTPTVLSASSGLVQISGVPTILSASSGFIQAWHAVTPTSSVAGASLGPVTSSAGVVANLSSGTVSLSSQITVTATGPVTVTSGTVTLSSVHTVTATGPVTVTSGLISVTSGTITSTAATNPWSSAPGFNIPVVTVSSGLVQLSSQITVTATGPVTVTSGTVTLSSVHTVTATAAQNPWSSAPSFNMPVVNVSSGLVQVSGTVTLSSAGLTQISGTVTVLSASSGLVQIAGTPAFTSTFILATPASTSGAVGPVTSSFGVLGNLTTAKIVPVLAASSGLVSIDLWQGTSSLSPSYVVATTISKVSTAPGSLYALHAYTTAAVGAIVRFYNAGTSSVVMNTSVVAAYLCNAQSTVGMNAIDYSLPPTGWFFSTQCSFDVVVTATSTATVYGSPTYVTVGYSTV